jgi:hypothetical protein
MILAKTSALLKSKKPQFFPTKVFVRPLQTKNAPEAKAHHFSLTRDPAGLSAFFHLTYYIRALLRKSIPLHYMQ